MKIPIMFLLTCQQAPVKEWSPGKMSEDVGFEVPTEPLTRSETGMGVGKT